MRKWPPGSDELKANAYKLNMGWFGSDTTNVVVSNSANGKAEASMNIPVPVWEIALVATCVAVIIFVCLSYCKKQLKKNWDRQIRLQIAKSRPSLENLDV
jgi:hypothetical protein